MKKTRKFFVRVIAMGLCLVSMLPNGLSANAAASKDYIITNPYANVDRDAYGQYKAQFHAHSTNSDGNNLTSEMVEDHYAKGYDILAMTDHNFTTSSWDTVDKGAMTSERVAEIEAGVGRDGKGMIGIANSNEQSQTDHINSFFVDFNNTSGATMSGTLQNV